MSLREELDRLAEVFELSLSLGLKRGLMETVQHPDLTFAHKGGDWDDIAMLLMTEARKAGFKTRLKTHTDDRWLFLQLEVLRPGLLYGKWIPLGPVGTLSPKP